MMGIGSSLLQFVESLRENRPLPPDAPRTPAPRAEVPVGPDPLDEVAVAVHASRQRLEALAARLTELKAKTGVADAAGTAAPTTR
jgi:hypothetical protein